MPGLEDLYREVILDHYRRPQHSGLREPFGAEVHHVNPTCGDELTLRLQLSDDLGTVQDISYDAQGCSISQSSASMMTTAVVGRTIDEARSTLRSFKQMMSIHEHGLEGSPEDDSAEVPSGLGDLEALRGVVKFPVRIKCATLGWNTFDQALAEAHS